MTKKDYELIASTLHDVALSDADRQETAEAFADRLAGTNPRFDRTRFIAAAVGK